MQPGDCGSGSGRLQEGRSEAEEPTSDITSGASMTTEKRRAGTHYFLEATPGGLRLIWPHPGVQGRQASSCWGRWWPRGPWPGSLRHWSEARMTFYSWGYSWSSSYPSRLPISLLTDIWKPQATLRHPYRWARVRVKVVSELLDDWHRLWVWTNGAEVPLMIWAPHPKLMKALRLAGEEPTPGNGAPGA